MHEAATATVIGISSGIERNTMRRNSITRGR